MCIIENLKRNLMNGQLPCVESRALISVLSMFRAFSPPKHIPNFGTISDPFQGQNRTLDMYIIKEGLESMGCFTYFNNHKIKTPSFF